jgi:cobalt-zinc-cadmium efflux system outer membrane protein
VRRKWLWAYCLIVCAVPAAAQPLRLEDVLDSVERNYPPLLAALAERDIADAELLQAQGRFDTQIGVKTGTDRFGYYSNQRLDFGLDQPFAAWGASAYGGWRSGTGRFAPYDGKYETRSLGEWRGGLTIPLLRNRSVDERRTGVEKARIGRRIADLSVDQQRLAIRQMAARRYWDWVAAGQRRRVALELLTMAKERDQQLRDAAQLGQIPAIEVTENQRQILQRQSLVVETERGIQQSAFDLSLFYRDASGEPRLPEDHRLPHLLPPTATLSAAQVSEDLAAAFRKRPEIARFAAQREQSQLDARLAKNDLRPALDLSFGFTAEGGAGSVRRGPRELEGALTFYLPLQRRSATGKLQAAEAKAGQFARREQFARDQVEAEILDAASAVRAAHQRAILTKDEVRVALDLAEAERERFRLGDSTLFTVNLREQAAADAELREVAAVNDYLRAMTVYEQATARLLP